MKKLFLCIIMCLYALICDAQGTYHDFCMSFGPYSIEFEVSNTQHTSGHTDKYQGSSGPDIIYRFVISVPMEVAISSRCSSAYSYSELYLLDSGGRMLDHNDDDYNNLGDYIHRTLPAGTYYVVSDYFAGMGDYITTTIRGNMSSGSGTSQANAINTGVKASDFTYSDTKDLSNYTDVISYISGKDIFYKFTLAVPMDISISNCGSAVPDTYIGLFESGTNNEIGISV